MSFKHITEYIPLDRVIALGEDNWYGYDVSTELSPLKKETITLFHKYFKLITHLSCLLKGEKSHDGKLLNEELYKELLKSFSQLTTLKTEFIKLSTLLEQEEVQLEKQKEIATISLQFINYLDRSVSNMEYITCNLHSILEALIYTVSHIIGLNKWWNNIYHQIHPYLDESTILTYNSQLE